MSPDIVSAPTKNAYGFGEYFAAPSDLNEPSFSAVEICYSYGKTVKMRLSRSLKQLFRNASFKADGVMLYSFPLGGMTGHAFWLPLKSGRKHLEAGYRRGSSIASSLRQSGSVLLYRVGSKLGEHRQNTTRQETIAPHTESLHTKLNMGVPYERPDPLIYRAKVEIIPPR